MFIYVSLAIIIVVLILKRLKDKKSENFENRNN